MTFKLLVLDLKSLWYHSHDKSWEFKNGIHMNDDGHRFAVLAAARSTYSAAATVIFDGIPVFVVIGDKNAEKPDRHESGWRWAWPHLVDEPEDLKVTVEFLVNPLGELGTAGLDEDKAVANMLGYSSHIDDILEEFGGEGHETVAFVGIIADALHTAFLNETPKVVGF